MSRQPTHSVVDTLYYLTVLGAPSGFHICPEIIRRQQVIIAVVSGAGPFCRECPVHTSLIIGPLFTHRYI